jgi:hypothetical protein
MLLYTSKHAPSVLLLFDIYIYICIMIYDGRGVMAAGLCIK